MFFLLRSAFWIVLVSFAIECGFIPGAPADARASASQVVVAVENAPLICQDQPMLCSLASAGASFASEALRIAGNSLAAEYQRRHQSG